MKVLKVCRLNNSKDVMRQKEHTWGTNEWVHSDLKYCSSCDVPTQSWEGINEKKKQSTKANDDKLFPTQQ